MEPPLLLFHLSENRELTLALEGPKSEYINDLDIDLYICIYTYIDIDIYIFINVLLTF